jgi:hypothetical protein
MARLIVEAVPAEKKSGLVGALEVYVSVSGADDGQPVTGLSQSNFRIAYTLGSIHNPAILPVSEANWEPDDNEPSGCYRLQITPHSTDPEWGTGERYAFGIQARVFRNRRVIHFGQTVVSIESLGP